MPRNSKAAKADAASRAAQEAKKPVLFYGADKENGFLSNMYIAVFVEEEESFNCNEQFFQAAKADLFGDAVSKKSIMKAKDPKVQKRLGKKVKGYDDEVWNKYRYNVMLKANYLKFTQSAKSSTLREQLLDTKNRELVEASTDMTWGAGMALDAAGKQEGGVWYGKNLQGHILESVRAALRGGDLDEQEPEFDDRPDHKFK